MVRGGGGGRPWGVGVGGGGGWEFAGGFVGLFAGGQIADDDFAITFEREDSVGDVVAVGGEDLSGEGSPGVEVFCGDGAFLREGRGRDAEESEDGDGGVAQAESAGKHEAPWKDSRVTKAVRMVV
jgi:hypothetical protein